jgi:serine O-acetyltransferase
MRIRLAASKFAGSKGASERDTAVEAAVNGLAKCDGDALSRALCRGIVDPELVVEWIIRAERLVRFQSNRSELRAEIPAVALRLEALLQEVELPADLTPEKVTESFILALPGIRQLLAQDVEAAFEGDPSAKDLTEIVVAFPSIRALSIHRIAHEFYRMNVPLLPRIMSEYAHDRTGIDIHPGAQIGNRFFIDHGTGVVIGETAEIGTGVRLYQGVTLGATTLRSREELAGVKRHPTIEDRVTIYAGATILGGDTVIGADSVIGGNVWLTASVPPGTRVVAEPPRHLMRSGQANNPAFSGEQLKWDI